MSESLKQALSLRVPYMSTHAFLNLLNKLKKEIKVEALTSSLSLFVMSLINSIIQEHKY